jgi:hypothetical protein
MLDDVTRREYIRQAKKQQRMDFASIEELIRKRGIKRLFHFTHVSNLSSILKEGIKPRRELFQSSHQYEQCDPDRYDGFLEGFCVSLSKPNTFLFNQKSRDKEFRLVVLEIAANSLLTQPFVAFPTNAANSTSTEGVKKKPDRYLGLQGLSGMFLGESLRIRLRLPQNEPTDLQSEILFFETIEPEKILKIHVPKSFPIDSRQEVEKIKLNHQEMKIEYVCECGILKPWTGEFRKYSSDWEKNG